MAALLLLSAVVISLLQSSEVDAFSLPGTTLNKQRSSYITTSLFAKKKKKASQQRRTAATAGKGFGSGNSQSPTTAALIAHTDSPTHATLIRWLQQHPTTFISPKFTIKQSKLGGYGGFSSTSGFDDGELIFRIPRDCCVTQDDALNDKSCGEIFQMAKMKRVPSYQMLMLSGFIAKEFLLSKRIKDKIAIKHWPYLQSIPWVQNQLDQEHVIFWSSEKVERLLGESLAYNDALMIRKTVDSAIR